uniref:Hint domain protein n=1 Tax=Pithovirus LCDPAC01 TaxID=2506600 RepID=A0A481YMF5_9VIRU|nr:MAG: hint domain protein [Pithovirus LCDPAC01]
MNEDWEIEIYFIKAGEYNAKYSYKPKGVLSSNTFNDTLFCECIPDCDMNTTEFQGTSDPNDPGDITERKGFEYNSVDFTGIITTDGDPYVCFFPETKILTVKGYRKIENIVIGDYIVYGDKKSKVLWNCVTTHKNPKLEGHPIIIKAGAFGNSKSQSIPFRDIYLSRWHAVKLDNKMTMADHLKLHMKRGVVIDTKKKWRGAVKYHNLLLEGNGNMIAEGLGVESLVFNDSNRKYLMKRFLKETCSTRRML